jgi:excisionase family DNA binding protein
MPLTNDQLHQELSELKGMVALLLEKQTETPIHQKRILTLPEACRFLGISESYCYKLTSAGVLPFSKPNGKTIFFEREKLEEWALNNATIGAEARKRKAVTYLTTKQQ